MNGEFFSPGKLLLTSEYLVLDGALALAIPTKLGQVLYFKEVEDGKSEVIWEAYHQNEVWLKARIQYRNWEIVQTNLPEAAYFVLKTLQNIQKISKKKFQNSTSYFFTTQLQFPSNFGLGSSSTLMNNLASWAEIDPFLLNEISLGGSGYDVAVAKENAAILFQKSDKLHIQKVIYQPIFKDNLIFVHLNKKQDSREGIRKYNTLKTNPNLISEFSEITKKVFQTQSIDEFSDLMEIHEYKLSQHLQIKTSKQIYFKECPVFVKSLGAWGGDFVMTRKFSEFEEYFSTLGFTNYFTWQDLIS